MDSLSSLGSRDITVLELLPNLLLAASRPCRGPGPASAVPRAHDRLCPITGRRERAHFFADTAVCTERPASKKCRVASIRSCYTS